jgi:hypothetical protein
MTGTRDRKTTDLAIKFYVYALMLLVDICFDQIVNSAVSIGLSGRPMPS